jgi:hypothetical protein
MSARVPTPSRTCPAIAARPGGLPAVSADGREVALGQNTPFSDPVFSAWVTVLDLRTGRYRTLGANLSGAWIRGISFVAGDSEIVADAFDGAHVWDVADGAIETSWVGQPGEGSVMAVDPSHTTAIVGSKDGSLAGFDPYRRARPGPDVQVGHHCAGLPRVHGWALRCGYPPHRPDGV